MERAEEPLAGCNVPDPELKSWRLIPLVRTIVSSALHVQVQRLSVGHVKQRHGHIEMTLKTLVPNSQVC